MSSPSAQPGRKGKTVEEIYKKMSQLEHILARPDSYVGSIEMINENMWVWDEVSCHMVNRNVSFVPGLYKIFDEIVVNSADNLMRDPKGMDTIKVFIDRKENSIKVWNNGKGLPITIHKEHNIYVPEMVFGNLLTSDNYDDNERKVTGGRNGYGAKLANIFSTKFIVRTGDRLRKLIYTQTFSNSMQEKTEPKIDSVSSTEDFTEVKFFPDLPKFSMNILDDDIVALMNKRVIDIAGTCSRKSGFLVYLNGNKVPISSFKEYVHLYLNPNKGKEGIPISSSDNLSSVNIHNSVESVNSEDSQLQSNEDVTSDTLNPWDKACKIHEKVSDRWEVMITLSDPEGGGGQFQQVSFVNSICTIKGGTHVSHVVDQICAAVIKKTEKRNKGGMQIKPYQVKNHIWVFINALIENPTFDSQTKETLTLKPIKFGSKCVLSDVILNKISKSEIVEQVLNWAKFKQSAALSSKTKSGSSNVRLLGIPKLEDANDAGTKNGENCTLILTEGDSAKALAVAGLSVIGRDLFGVFPLRGKPLNAREATFKQTLENKEIQNILKIVGLDPKCDYESTKGFRYGSIMVMTDQDLDGSHIKGLLINMFHHWWPSLLKTNTFVKEFVTPIVKCVKGSVELSFFTLSEYGKWEKENNMGKGWKLKYYKGLGTSTSKEAKEYFSDLDKHQLRFIHETDQDGEVIDMAFNKKRADDRKEWINDYIDGDCVDHNKSTLTYSDFINKELVQFSKYDVMRSIPSMVDGLKPSQRKVLFCAFKRGLKTDVKVAQFVGYVSEHSAYHHGEASLEACIIGMAQNFVGSNNLNVLYPSGQFGTRMQGGKDSAASRYIYTRLCSYTRNIYHPDDDDILEYLFEEGQYIEPKYYLPIIPMVLVNGAEGIGTGWSTSIMNYDPREIISQLRGLIRGKPMTDIKPYYRGFTGRIEVNDKGGYDFIGRASVSDYEVLVTELPVKTWTQTFKEYLHEMAAYSIEQKKGDRRAKEKAKKEKNSDSDSDIGNKRTNNNNNKGNNNNNKGDDKDKEKRKSIGVGLTDIKEYHTERTVYFKCTLDGDASKKIMNEVGLEKTFKLRSSSSIANMVLFDRHCKIRKYDTVLDIMKDFASLRLDMYGERKQMITRSLTKEILIHENKHKFVLMVVAGTIVFSKKKIINLLEELKKLGFLTMEQILIQSGCTDTKIKTTKTNEENIPIDEKEDEDEETKDNDNIILENSVIREMRVGYDYLLSMAIWSLTSERSDALEKSLLQKEKDLEIVKNTSTEQMWDRDLAMLQASIDLDEYNEIHEDEKNLRKTMAQANKGKMKEKKEKEKEKGKDRKGVGKQIENTVIDMMSNQLAFNGMTRGQIFQKGPMPKSSVNDLQEVLKKYKITGDIKTIDVETSLSIKPMDADVWRRKLKSKEEKKEENIKIELKESRTSSPRKVKTEMQIQTETEMQIQTETETKTEMQTKTKTETETKSLSDLVKERMELKMKSTEEKEKEKEKEIINTPINKINNNVIHSESQMRTKSLGVRSTRSQNLDLENNSSDENERPRRRLTKKRKMESDSDSDF